MKVIENNYNEVEKEIICPHCGSKLTYGADDIIPTGGENFIYCGACHRAICIGETESKLEPDFKPPFYCDNCGGDFNASTHIGADGSLFATCPECGEEVWVGSGIELNPKNIEYPLHFFSYKDGVKLTDKQVTEYARLVASRLDKNNDYYMISSGDTLVIAVKTDEDYGECTVYVCKSYDECNFKIPKENF